MQGNISSYVAPNDVTPVFLLLFLPMPVLDRPRCFMHALLRLAALFACLLVAHCAKFGLSVHQQDTDRKMCDVFITTA